MQTLITYISQCLGPAKPQFNNKHERKQMSKACLVHNQQLKYFCVSKKCREIHAGVCDHSDCLGVHDHPVRQLIQIQKLRDIIDEECFPLDQLVKKVSAHFQEMGKRILIQLNHDRENLLKIVRRLEFCQKPETYSTIVNLNEQRYSSNSAFDVRILFEELNDSGRRSRIKMDVNKIQSQLTPKSINQLLESRIYKEAVLQGFKERGIMLDSGVLNSQQNSKLGLLLNTCGINLSSFQRVYSGTKNGFLASEYHNRVDNTAPTLGVIKANNHIFGYYLNCKVNTSSVWIPDSSKKSFIWSLDHGTLHRLIDSKEAWERAAYGGNQGPQIGSGLDIFICDRCDKFQKSGGELGGSYTLPKGIKFKSQESSTYLAGKKNFLVEDYQVFVLLK